MLAKPKLYLYLFCLLSVLFVACQSAPAELEPEPEQSAASGLPDADLSLPERTYNARATVFQVDPSNSYVYYYADELFLEDSSVIIGRNTNEGDFTAVGTTRDIRGELALDLTAEPPLVLGGDFAVNLVNLRTNQPHRDDMIRRFWLESNKYPVARFTLTDVSEIPADYLSGEPTEFTMMGELAVREVTIPVEFATTAVLEDGVLRGTAVANLRMTDFGFDPPNMAKVVVVEDLFKLEIDILATVQEQDS